MRVQKRPKNVLLPPTSVASNACDKKDAPVDRRAPQFSEPRAWYKHNNFWALGIIAHNSSGSEVIVNLYCLTKRIIPEFPFNHIL